MKIVVKLEKAGEAVAQTVFDTGVTKDPMKRIGKALKAFRKEHPDSALFDDDVRLKFEKAE